MDAVDPHDPVPLYQQVARELRNMIASGELAPRDPLPSELTIQQRYQVSRGTARRAVEMLRDEGLIYTVPQRASYVAER